MYQQSGKNVQATQKPVASVPTTITSLVFENESPAPQGDQQQNSESTTFTTKASASKKKTGTKGAASESPAAPNDSKTWHQPSTVAPNLVEPRVVSLETADPAKIITTADPAEAAAAAFNQPVYSPHAGQYISSGVHPMLLQVINPPNEQGQSSLYVGDLSSDVTEVQLYEIFSSYGAITTIRVCKDQNTRRSLGYAYVNFLNQRDAERALAVLNYQNLKDRPMRIMWAQKDPRIRKSGAGNVYIKNLDPSIDTKALYDTFQVFGKIMSCKVATDAHGSKGYGYIHFENPEDANTVVESVNGMLLNERKVFVGPHIHKKDRLSMRGSSQPKFTNVYVKNLAEDIDDSQLHEIFQKFGKIVSAVVTKDAEGKSKGFGFVCFENPDHAFEAVEKMHDKPHKGKVLYVVRAQKRSERDQTLREQYEMLREEQLKKYRNTNVYIKNLDDSIDDEMLNKEFSQFGNIISAKVMCDENTGMSRCFGFVCFSTPEEATKAVTEMNGKMLKKKPIYIGMAQPKEVRRAQIAAQMQRFKMRPQPISVLPDVCQHSAMIYHPQGFVQQTQSGMPYFPGGGIMRQRWVNAAQQPLNPAVPMATPVYLQPPGQPVTQPNPTRHLSSDHARVGVTSNAHGQPIISGSASLGSVMGHRKAATPVPGFVSASQSGSAMMSQLAQRGTGARHVASSGTGTFQQHGNVSVGQDSEVVAYPVTASSATSMVQMPIVNPIVVDPQVIASLPAEQRKRALGEALFLAVHRIAPQNDGKITGMLLEMSSDEILAILKDPVALKAKVQEALKALEDHRRRQRQKSTTQQSKQQNQSQKQRLPSQQQHTVSNTSVPAVEVGITEASA